MLLWTAFTVGLFGSLHCLGMCGPIAVVVGSQSRQHKALNALLYNTGRIITYTIMGALIGLIGKGLMMAGLQKWLSIVLGVVLLILAIFSVNFESRLVNLPFVTRFMFSLKSQLGRFLQKHTFNAFFAVGILNGLLPCGLVYMAVAGSVSTGEISTAMAYMAIFGLGTFPMMMVSTFAGNIANFRARNILKKLYPVFLILFAVLFLSRGLNFNLPVDFLFWDDMDKVPMCH